MMHSLRKQIALVDKEMALFTEKLKLEMSLKSQKGKGYHFVTSHTMDSGADDEAAFCSSNERLTKGPGIWC